MRGLLIVFEGIDRSGKSTQAGKLADTLNNSILLSFPNRSTPIGRLTNLYLTSKDYKSEEYTLDDYGIHLLFSANRWESKKRILELLDSGFHVICDRYFYSGIAHSAAKGLNIDWCRNSEVGLPIPDLIIYLQIDVSTAEKREGCGTGITSFQQKVKSIYENDLIDESWFILDGDKPIEDLADDINSIVMSKL